MKERPILFSAPMVRAILPPIEIKTNTRRTQGLEVINESPDDWQLLDMSVGVRSLKQQATFKNKQDGRIVTVKCPYGRASDQLWVRETWCPRSNGQLQIERVQKPFFKATDGDDGKPKPTMWRWRPSIHMPRWASRIQLEITGVRAERLQDISEEDVIAEGVLNSYSVRTLQQRRTQIGSPDVIGIDRRVYPDAQSAFAALWESINGAGSWDANPWVWCTEFKRVKP